MKGNAHAMRPGSQAGRREVLARRATGHAAIMQDRDRSADDVDFFPTRPWGGRAGGELIRQLDPRARTVWECAAGAGHLAHGLKDYFATVHGSDICIYDPALYAANGWVLHDFTADDDAPFSADWVATNPPFDLIEPFLLQAWARARRGVALLLRLNCLEGQGRHGLLHGPRSDGEAIPTRRGPLHGAGDGPRLTAVAPFSERIAMHKGFWDPTRTTATAYGWFFFCKPGVGPRPPVICGKPRPFILDIAPGTEARLTRADDAQLFEAREGPRP